MNTVIIEDEPLVANDLVKLIEQIDPSINIVKILDSVKTSIEYFKTHEHPDLIFMDIQLNDGVSFDLFKHVTINCPIIFTTAYDQYAIRAFKVSSIDYLLKPVDKNELRESIDKFKRIESLHGNVLKEQLELMVSKIGLAKDSKIYKERFTARSGKSLVVLNYSNVACFKKDTLIYIITNDKQQFVTDFESLEDLEELLDPKHFFRANRQMIININVVESYRTDLHSKILLVLKQPVNLTVDISREKAQSFRDWVQG